MPLPLADKPQFDNAPRIQRVDKGAAAQAAREAELQRQIDALTAQNAALQARSNSSLTLKVSEKGAVMVIGLGKWPTTLYQEQWLRLLPMADEIRAFIQANKHRLSTK